MRRPSSRSLPTRASARVGRPPRPTRPPALQQRTGAARRSLALIDEIGGPSTSTTTRGAGPTRATPRSGGGSARRIAAARAICSSCVGPPASRRGPDRTEYAHTSSTWCRRADRSTSSRCEIRGVTQSPIQGALRAHARRPARREPAPHQYFEMLGHRAIYHDGWRVVCPWPGLRSQRPAPDSATPSPGEALGAGRDGWELYHTDEDFTESQTGRGTASA